MAGKMADVPVLARFNQLPMALRVVYGRPRTFIALGIATASIFVLPHALRLTTRLLIGWDIFAALYLVLVAVMMLKCGHQHIRRKAMLQDGGRVVVLLVAAFGALASEAAVVSEV